MRCKKFLQLVTAAIAVLLVNACHRSESLQEEYSRKIGSERDLAKEAQRMRSNSITTIRFICPPSFRGTVQVRLDKTRGASVEATTGVITLAVRSNGVVSVKSFSPFQKDFRLEARYVDGRKIATPSESSPQRSDEVIFQGGGLLGGTGYPAEGVYIFFLGTEEERRKAATRPVY
jgi:hypothetical protein